MAERATAITESARKTEREAADNEKERKIEEDKRGEENARVRNGDEGQRVYL